MLEHIRPAKPEEERRRGIQPSRSTEERSTWWRPRRLEDRRRGIQPSGQQEDRRNRKNEHQTQWSRRQPRQQYLKQSKKKSLRSRNRHLVLAATSTRSQHRCQLHSANIGKCRQELYSSWQEYNRNLTEAVPRNSANEAYPRRGQCYSKTRPISVTKLFQRSHIIASLPTFGKVSEKSSTFMKCWKSTSGWKIVWI